MLIVYQSLESTGTKDDVSSTFMTGNSFKRNVHDAIQPETFRFKSRVWENDKVVYDTTDLTTPVATRQQSEALSKAIKNIKDDNERNQTALDILAKIIDRIVDNASACTRPKGLVRPFVRRPDVIVLGEMYASSLRGQVLSGYVVIGGIDPNGDARNRFTVLVQTGFNGRSPEPRIMENIEPLLEVDRSNKNKDEHSKCMMIKVRGWLVAFVHTPNNIKNEPEQAAQYLHNNAQRFGEGSRLDLVMGDTNQPSSDTVKNYMNSAYNRKVVRAKRSKETEGTTDVNMDEEPLGQWDHSVMRNKKQVIRGYTNYEVSGTNSNYKSHFDIACSPHAHVSLSGLTVHNTEEDELSHKFSEDDEEPSFIFHGLTDKFVEWNGLYYAFSDHNGVIVEVLRDKPDHRIVVEQRRRGGMIEHLHRSKKRKMIEWKKPDEDKE